MKKSILLWMSAVLMLSVGMMSCSSDDDGVDVETLDENHKNIIGKWQLHSYYSGWGISEAEAEPDKLTLIFDKDGTVNINIKDERFSSLFSEGTYKYSFEDVILVKDKEPATALLIGERRYDFICSDYEGDKILTLWNFGWFDGLECNFKKVE